MDMLTYPCDIIRNYEKSFLGKYLLMYKGLYLILVSIVYNCGRENAFCLPFHWVTVSSMSVSVQSLRLRQTNMWASDSVVN